MLNGHSTSFSSDVTSAKEGALPYLLSFASFTLGYLISAGPAVFVTRRIDLPALTKIVEGLYLPIVLVVRLDVPFLSDVIRAWVSLFR